MPRQPYSEAVPSDEEERFPPSPLRFLSPRRGTEGVEKTIEGRFSKKPSLRGKSNANECNESSLSNCRVQLALSTKKDGMILEKD